MASLEELLAKEGFKKGKAKQGLRGSAAPRAVSMPLYPDRGQNLLDRNTESRFQKNRARSGAFDRGTRSGWSENGGGRGGRQKYGPVRGESSVDSYDEEFLEIEGFETGGSNQSREVKSFNGRSRNSRLNSVDEAEKYKADTIVKPKVRMGRNPKQEGPGNLRCKEADLHDTICDEKLQKRNITNIQMQPSFNYDVRSRKDDEPTLDEAAIWAVVSILTSYIKLYFKDGNFRASIRHSCAACLGLGATKQKQQKDHNGAVADLKEAIQTVERVVKDNLDSVEVTKAFKKLTVISGLSSTDRKDGFAFGSLDSYLAACAHLYLSVIYKLQKKDKLSAKHLLQVFCSSPYQARTNLLPALWDRLFLPNLSHLKSWYEEEVKSIAQSPMGEKKTKLLVKMYNDVLDKGTHAFATYYKEWLIEETEAPALPSIHVPFTSYHGISQESNVPTDSDEGCSPGSSVTTQLTISNSLYLSSSSQSKNSDAADRIESKDEEEEIDEEQLTIHSDNLNQYYEETRISSQKFGIQNRIIGQIQEHHNPFLKDSSIATQLMISDSLYLSSSSQSKNLDPADATESRDEEEEIDEEQLITHSNNRNQDYEETKISSRKFGIQNHIVGQTQEDHKPFVKELNSSINAEESELYLKKLAQAVFKPQLSTVSELTKTRTFAEIADTEVLAVSLSAESFTNDKDADEGSFFSATPQDFVCPLTGQVFEDPVTLETGQTFEQAAIKEWFNRGNTTCPVSGQELECLLVPETNLVLKHLIASWKSEHFKNLLGIAVQIAGCVITQDRESKNELVLSIIEQLLGGLSLEEQLENARHLMALGGLDFLLRRFELANVDEKTRIVGLLLCCIKADGCCRNYLAVKLNSVCILELLHSKQVNARTNIVLLLTELLYLKRRATLTLFLSGLHTEAIVNTMHVLLVYLHSSPPEERAQAAVLLLHFDLMVDSRKYSIYREEAINSITLSLNGCLSDKNVIPNSRKALLMLGGHFSSSGDILTEAWMLQQAGFIDGPSAEYIDNDEEIDESVLNEETSEKEKWLNNVTMALLGNARRSFLEALSKCLDSGNVELVRACLTTVAWLSHSLVSLSTSEIQLFAFSILIPRLKECLGNSMEVENRVLACISLLNFSNIPGSC
ncbi:putative E3 ubiquitin-protein ligase LIN isoform X3 [Ananas comosus]|uniref:RING-type E3 ubiquitin transferase n=1 Tax=Ananas comosus TaxID=4615 RepID=A0A6P5EJP9_ANACO|nr:putative E3 ubiquitin-protein ligase LIN isoform X3 [Ananas comosus]